MTPLYELPVTGRALYDVAYLDSDPPAAAIARRYGWHRLPRVVVHNNQWLITDARGLRLIHIEHDKIEQLHLPSREHVRRAMQAWVGKYRLQHPARELSIGGEA